MSYWDLNNKMGVETHVTPLGSGAAGIWRAQQPCSYEHGYGDGDAIQLRRWGGGGRCHTVTKMGMETAMPYSYEDVGAMPLCDVKKWMFLR